jgi:predicted MFS family arabinose efflux permease
LPKLQLTAYNAGKTITREGKPLSKSESLPETLAGHARAPAYLNSTSAVVWWACFSFAALLGFSRLAYGLLLPSIRTDMGGNYSLYGLVGTANLIGYMVGTTTVPIVLTRYRDREKLNIITLVAMNLSMLATSVCFDLIQLSIVRFLTGLFSAYGTVLTMSLALERVLPSRRGRASGLVWMGGSVGIIISGLIAPVIITSGSGLAWRLVWVAMSVVGMISAFGVYRQIRMHPAPEITLHSGQTAPPPARLSELLSELLRPRGFLLLTISYFSYGFGYIIYVTFIITLLTTQGMSSILAGLVWAMLGTGGVVGSFVWGRVVDRWPNGFSMALSLVLSGLGGLSVLGGIFALEIAGAILIGLTFLGPPLMITVLLKRAVAPERYTSSFSFLTAIFAVGQFLGPMVGGIIVDTLGLTAAITTTAGAMTLATLLAIGYGFLHKNKTG